LTRLPRAIKTSVHDVGVEASCEITYTNPHRIQRASRGSCLRLWRTTRANIGQRSNRYVSLRQFLECECGLHCAGMELETKESYYDMKNITFKRGVLVLHVAGSPNAAIHQSVVASSCTRNWAKTSTSLVLVKVRLVRIGIASLKLDVWLRVRYSHAIPSHFEHKPLFETSHAASLIIESINATFILGRRRPRQFFCIARHRRTLFRRWSTLVCVSSSIG
jgi:hypothetical protein